MKIRNIFMLLAAMTAAVLTGCKDKDPFDTQKASDNPRILTPYNESGTNTFTYNLANPDAHMVDSCIITPSSYTTVEWYLDNFLAHTGLKIDQCFPAGTYKLLIQATTTEGRQASRYGTVKVMPYAEDPFSEDPKNGRHYAPGKEAQLDGEHLDLATSVLITTDLYANDKSAAINPTYHEEHLFKFMVPQLEDGKYFVRLINAEGKAYGADHIEIHNGPTALAGYKEFTMNKVCTVTGLNLQEVNSVTVDGEVITPTAVTEGSVTFIAPQRENEREVLISMSAAGKAVKFLASDGSYVESIKVNLLAKKFLSVVDGPIYVGCNGDPDWTARVIDDGFKWSKLTAGQELYITAHRDGATTDYNNFKIMTNDWAWSAPDGGNFEFDGKNDSTFTVIVTDAMIAAVTDKGGLCAAGHGTIIDRIFYEAPEETTIWEGSAVIDWNADICNITPTVMASVPLDATLYIYYEVPEAEYHQYRICTKWWNNVPGGDQADIVVGTTPNPLTLTYDATFKSLSDAQEGWSCVGFGYTVTKITYK